MNYLTKFSLNESIYFVNDTNEIKKGTIADIYIGRCIDKDKYRVEYFLGSTPRKDESDLFKSFEEARAFGIQKAKDKCERVIAFIESQNEKEDDVLCTKV